MFDFVVKNINRTILICQSFSFYTFITLIAPTLNITNSIYHTKAYLGYKFSV